MNVSHNHLKKHPVSDGDRDPNRFGVDHALYNRRNHICNYRSDSRNAFESNDILEKKPECISEYKNHQLKRYNSGGSDNDILRTAIHQNYKSNITRSMCGYSIARSKSSEPIRQTTQSPTRPPFQRSISYTISSNLRGNKLVKRQNLEFFMNDSHSIQSTKSGSRNNSVSRMDNVSPLTVLEDRYDIKRPIHHTCLSKTENSFENLQKASASKSDSSSHQSSLTVNMNPSNRRDSLNQYHIRIASRNHPVTNHVDDNASSNDEDDNFESKSEEGDELGLDIDDDYGPYHLTLDIMDVFQEMHEFQQNFLKKDETEENVGISKMNRTTKRLNDYKTLTAEPSKPDLIQFLNSYVVKIQYESISSQYTSIRCRFPTKIATGKSKTKLRTQTGILGFINRYNESLLDEKSISYSATSKFTLLNFTNPAKSKTEQYIQTMWDQQLQMFNQSEEPIPHQVP